jgi:hypothetical protein
MCRRSSPDRISSRAHPSTIKRVAISGDTSYVSPTLHPVNSNSSIVQCGRLTMVTRIEPWQTPDCREASCHDIHFSTVTIVPQSVDDTSSNPSNNCLIAQRPRSDRCGFAADAIAVSFTTGIPGPSSRATMRTPARPSALIRASRMLPRRACRKMLRANSETAAPTSITPLDENPACVANSRP